MKRTIPILLAVLLLLLPACTPAEKETVTMELHEVTRSVFYAPQYIAISLGFFEEERVTSCSSIVTVCFSADRHASGSSRSSSASTIGIVRFISSSSFVFLHDMRFLKKL